MNRRASSYRVAVFLAALACSAAFGQTVDTATVVGTVSDPTGAAVPGATMRANHVATNTVYRAVTNAEGYYRTPPLRIGEYTIDVEMGGFKKTSMGGVVLNVGDVRRIDFALEVGQVTETIAVTAQAPLLQTTEGSAGAVMENTLVVGLPLNGRDYLQLAKISPGVSDPRGQGISVAGSQGTQVNFLIDGIDNNNLSIASQGGQKETLKPQIDAIQEFKVVTNSYSAEYGRSMGGVVTLTTKSGTNEYHGTAFYFGRNEGVDARNFFAPPGQSKPPFKRHQYGFSAGGPVTKNKAFFFGDAQWTNIRQSRVNIVSVPPLAWRQGDFSVLGASTVYDPATYNAAANTRQPFPGNVVPRSNFDRVTTGIINWWPAPQTAAAANNYRWVVPVREDDLNWDARYDQTLTPKDNFYFRFSKQNSDAPRSPTLPDTADGLRKQGVNNKVFSNHMALVYNRIWRPSLVSSFRAGWNRIETNNSADVGPINPIIGVTLNNGLEAITQGSAVFSTTGFAALSSGGYNFIISQTRQFSADLTWIRGDHTVKLGQATFWLQTFISNYGFGLGNFYFDGRFTQNVVTGGGGQSLADFLLGYTYQALDENMRHTRLRAPWFQQYVQDDWKVSDHLSLNLGLRYEMNLPWVEKGNRMANFDIDTDPNDPSLVVAEVAGSGWKDRALQNVSTKNFAPRFGFAYRVSRSTVVRGGYGLFYGNIMNTGGQEWMLINPPFHASVLLTTDRRYPTLRVQDGLPPCNLCPGGASPLTLSSFERNGKWPLAQQWNLNIQREVLGGILWEIGYFGAKGNHIVQKYDLNYALPGPGDINSRRRWRRALWPGTDTYVPLGALNAFRYNANNLYHSLQTRAEKRFSRGLSCLVSYIWSKNIGDGGWMTGEGGGAGITWGVQNPLDLRAERSLMQVDLRHRFVGSWIYELPAGRGKAWGAGWSRVPNSLFGGWTVAGIGTLRTGYPMNLTVLGNPSNTGQNQTGSTAVNSDRPNVVGNWHLPNPSPERWFNTEAFVRNPPFTFGNAGRNILPSPGLVSFDLALYKSFQPLERLRVEFRCEAFNAFNTPPLGFANTEVGNRAFATITSAGAPRTLQFGLKLIF